ncbi:MAG: YsnF/AvaK domain-containing protein [Dehalococcoidia bacterium]
MMSNRGPGSELTVGSPVYTVDGDHLGKVKEVQGGVFKVDAPHQLDYWLSMGCVASAAGDRVTLSVAKDRLDEYKSKGPESIETNDAMVRGETGAETQTGQLTTDSRDLSDGAARSRTDSQGGQTVQLKEEQLRVNKEQVQTGEVGIRKEVVSEEKTLNVPVTHEEVRIERRPADGQPADRAIGEGAGQTVKVPVREERVNVEKQPVVREDVSVSKQAVQETQQVSGTVRREEARVEREGDVSVSGDRPGLSSTENSRRD